MNAAMTEAHVAVDNGSVAATHAAAVQLQVAGIVKTYVPKEGPVLQGIDLAVHTGEMVSLLGPSGCGKSTLLRVVAGFIEPERGSVVIGDRDVTTMATHRRGVGIVHQSHALWPHLTVAENVAFGLEMQGVKRPERERRVIEMLDLVGLGGLERRMPTQLSGGQQQRVALARALVVRPRVLLLDEPLSSLDANLRVHLREEIRRLQRELDVATLFVTHDREEAMAVSDRIVVLDGGRIAQQGSAVELYQRPCSKFVMSFTGATVTFPGTVVAARHDQIGVTGELGRLALRAPDLAVEPGDAVQLCIRPDDLVLHDVRAADDGRPTVRGTLVDVSFLGTSVEARVALADGRRIGVRLAPRRIDDLPRAGAEIALGVDPDHLHVFAA